MLGPKRKGDIAELHVASVLLAYPELEVFTAACDDGHGSDLAVRSARTGRWCSVQVKATSLTANPFVSLRRFRESSDFILAAVILDDRGLPERTYMVSGDAWSSDDSGALGRNDGGGSAGPYVEVRTMGAKYQEALEPYRAERQLGRL